MSSEEVTGSKPREVELTEEERDAIPQILVHLGVMGGRAPRKAIFDEIMEPGAPAGPRAEVEATITRALIGSEVATLEQKGDAVELVLRPKGIELLSKLAAKVVASAASAKEAARETAKDRKIPKCPRCRRRTEELRTTVLYFPGVEKNHFLRAFPFAPSLGCEECRAKAEWPARAYVVPFAGGETAGPVASSRVIAAGLRAEADRLLSVALPVERAKEIAGG